MIVRPLISVLLRSLGVHQDGPLGGAHRELLGPDFKIDLAIEGALLEVPGLPHERRLLDCAEGCVLPRP
jgi:hypothetical protein